MTFVQEERVRYQRWQFISAAVLDPIQCMHELGDSMESDVVCELLCAFPDERSNEGQETHYT